MKKYKIANWVCYIGDDQSFDDNKVGKWMYFFSDKKLVDKFCKDAIKNKIVVHSKYSDADEGVACFYLHYDDIETHKKLLHFFIDNNLIRKTKAGRLYNISFKLDNQTRAGEYNKEFHSEIKLSKFVDLDSGKWIYD
ncbi:MAG: hypothetical protein LBI19_05225 [Oscillospiraceae bacterium]|jgi:hypothetical protein|nr:hypothetical protein [Oscillospiraceae bacterium]